VVAAMATVLRRQRGRNPVDIDNHDESDFVRLLFFFVKNLFVALTKPMEPRITIGAA
jgi:hypothetical protein